MGETIVVGPIDKGLRTDRTPFVIDNDSFPKLINAFQWRGRIKRKRGVTLLNRLQRFFNSANPSYGSITSFVLVAGAGNLLTAFSLQANGNIVPGSVHLTDTTTGNVYTDPGANGILVGAPAGSGTINYATGAITIVGGAGDTITTVSFLYYPDLPVMGLEDLVLDATQFPETLAFDTKYSYNIQTFMPYGIYDVSFYKNPITGTYVGYTEKTNVTRTSWNGQNYQQFWTTNYQGALWATNGINVPFAITNIGMQYKPIVTTTIVAGGPPALVTLQITGHGLVVGDFLFINEVVTTTGINFQTGYVTIVVDANNVTVEFPNATIATNGTGGIAQYLTNRSDITKDVIRWYDGDPTNGSATAPVLNGHLGWVNFAPPLSNLSYSIAELPAAQYYLVGARMIVPFKDRLLFFGPVVQTSSAGSQLYLQDTIIYSQNGTPYYTASFTGSVTSAATVFHPILVPKNQTATANAYFEDVTGYGGFIDAGVEQPIVTVSPNEDVLIVGFSNKETRMVYTGNDLLPFNLFTVNSELGSGSTFSIINMDRGVFTSGDHGIIITSQIGSQRVDLEILDQIFQFELRNNGTERVTAQRDFIGEWIYLTYLSNDLDPDVYKFPNQTLLYNYREQTWGVFNETFTTYGQFRKRSGYTWSTIGDVLSTPTWTSWTEPWDSGSTTLMQAQVIAGNQQGFVFTRDEGTSEDSSLYIQSFSGSVVTSPDHGLMINDFIIIEGAIGTISTQVNGKIFQVSPPITQNTFTIDPPIAAGVYSGGGTITRMYVPQIQTKQFPVSWGMSRKTRLGAQLYLFSATTAGQIELQIFLSQNAADAYNDGPIVPAVNSQNAALIYSDTLFTSPDVPIQSAFRLPLGTIGNGVLTTFNFNYPSLFLFDGDIVPGSVFIKVGSVATFTDDGAGAFTVTGTGLSGTINYNSGIVVINFSVAPTSQLTITNFQYVYPNIQTPTAGQQSQIWQRMNTSLIGDTVQIGFTMSEAQMRDTELRNQFAEIELHGFALEVSPSQVLA